MNWPIIFHQEFSGAITQVQELADVLPERAVVVFDGSQVGNFLAPPLTFLHDKEAMVFWPKEGEGSFEPEDIEAIATAGFTEGREMFFVSTHEDAPLSAKYDLYSIRAMTLKVPQLEHALDHFPQKIERLELPYRVYHLRPAVGCMGYEAESLLHEVGRVIQDDDASWGEAMYADPEIDRQGHLVYGPYVTLAPGPYRVVFRLKVGTQIVKDRPVAVLDVTTDSGRTKLAQVDIWVDDFGAPGLYQVFTLEFDNPLMQALEFRVFFSRAVGLWVDNIQVFPSER